MLKLFRGGELHGPQPLGTLDLLVVGERIARIGGGDAGVGRTELPCEVVDARGCLIVPGFIDVHAHLIGTGGEQGFASRTPEVPFEELVSAGVTTVVGCLGTDDMTRTPGALLGRVRQLQRQGLTALMYTGSFHVPAPTLTGGVRTDLLYIPEVVGIGEVAIADFRSAEPSAAELSRIASDGLVGGLLGEKAGVLHLHVGPGKGRLSLLREVLDRFELPARQLYPTHVERTVELLDEAIALARRGSFVDFDCIEPVAEWVQRYAQRGGDLAKLTLSSDAHAPEGFEGKLRDEVLGLVREQVLPLERALALVGRNAAAALKLPHKGRLEAGLDADLLLLEKGSLRIRDVYAKGRALQRDGRVLPPASESFVME